jgi:hypothetical protein
MNLLFTTLKKIGPDFSGSIFIYRALLPAGSNCNLNFRFYLRQDYFFDRSFNNPFNSDMNSFTSLKSR